MQGWDKLPEKFRDNVNRLHLMNAEYKHMQWDEKTLREECAKISKECVAKYDSFEHMISRVDFGRYVILYNYGGISIDTDMYPMRSISNTPGLDKHDFIISSAAYPYNIVGYLNNGVIICKEKHDILLKIINDIINDRRKTSDFMSKDLFVHKTTGPLFIRRELEPFMDRIYILDYKYYEPCVSADKFCKVSDEAIMDHRHELSWMSEPLKIFMVVCFFALHYIWLILVIIVGFIVYAFRKSLFKTIETKRTQSLKKKVRIA